MSDQTAHPLREAIDAARPAETIVHQQDGAPIVPVPDTAAQRLVQGSEGTAGGASGPGRGRSGESGRGTVGPGETRKARMVGPGQ